MNYPWRVVDDGLELFIRLTPKGGRDRLESVISDTDGIMLLKARVSAAPVDGAANKALIKLLSKELGIAKSAITFISGESSRIKRLLVEGDIAELEHNLSAKIR